MAKGERRREKAPAAQGGLTRGGLAHSPLASALRERQKAEAAATTKVEADRKRDAARAQVAKAAPAAKPTPPVDDETLFRSAMSGVAAIPDALRAPAPRPPPPEPAATPVSASEDGEAMARLADLCAGLGAFSLEDTAEYIEGSAPGVDRRLVRRLRRGEYSVQAHLDLHGQTRDEARAHVEQFIVSARARGLRCVLLVHGRGLNSKDNIPVLKQSVAAWLQRGRIGKCVLAFATARPHDGGSGAVYVLLKR